MFRDSWYNIYITYSCQKVTFSTKKEPMKQAYTENPVSIHNWKPLRTLPVKKCCLYAQIPLSTQRIFYVNQQCLPFTTTLFWLAKIILCTHRLLYVNTGYFCVSSCHKFYFSWESYFLDKSMLIIRFCSDNNIKIEAAVTKQFKAFIHFFSKPCICIIFRRAMAIISVS